MENKLRRLLGRNLRYTQMNEKLDAAIQQLQGNSSPEAQMQLNALQQQRQNIDNLMAQPMTDAEYELYDDDGHYLGDNPPPTQQNSGGFGQAIADGINHAAQGASLGWSDEAFGAIGGAGRVMANGVMRAFGQNVNGESFGDAWDKGYQEYRDFARQELQDGYQRNPAISAGAEVVGALATPIKPFAAKDRVNMFGKVYHTTQDLITAGPRTAVANGIIGGVGITNNHNPWDYVQNTAFSTAGNFIGNRIQNRLLGINDMYKKSRMMIDGLSNIGASTTNNFINKHRNNNDEDY